MKPTEEQLKHLRTIASKCLKEAHKEYFERNTRTVFTTNEDPHIRINVSNKSLEAPNRRSYAISFYFRITTEYGTFEPRILFTYCPVNFKGQQGLRLITSLCNKDGTCGYNLTTLLPKFTKIADNL
jgi:hypothetical protein